MSEIRDPILENMEAFYKECHAQVKEAREKLKIATMANEQFKSDLHQRDAENAQLREKLAKVRGVIKGLGEGDTLDTTNYGSYLKAICADTLAIIDGEPNEN